jgi:hypothetical protein
MRSGKNKYGHLLKNRFPKTNPKPMIMKFLVIIPLILLYFNAFPQDWFTVHAQGENIPGYVLGIAGDTIQGSVKYDFPIIMQKRVYFNPIQGSSGREEYTPDNIRGYSINKKLWISTTVIMETYNGQYKFKRFGILESDPGPISLLRIFDEQDKQKKNINSEEAERMTKNIMLNYPENSLNSLYIKKNEGDAELLSGKSFKKSFISKIRIYVSDYEALMNKIENKQYQIEDIRKIVAEYNKWFESKFQ